MTAMRLTGAEAVQFFIAAMHAVSTDGVHAVEFQSGQELLDWVLRTTEMTTVAKVLDGMLRERRTA